MQPPGLTYKFVVFFAVLPLLGCFATSEASVTGTYTAAAPCVTITLIVKRDHSFVQTIRETPGKAYQRSGRWRLDNNGRFFFESALDRSPQDIHQVGSLPDGIVERLPRGKVLGPIQVTCPDSPYEIDYVQPWGR
jgi:hypothetical protein